MSSCKFLARGCLPKAHHASGSDKNRAHLTSLSFFYTYTVITIINYQEDTYTSIPTYDDSEIQQKKIQSMIKNSKLEKL